MCGFCGVLRLDGAPVEPKPLAAMNEAIRHRGPDGGRVVVDGPVALANRRLSILDLSPAADLPMTRGPVTLAYNGEVYNYLAERERLCAAGESFSTTGDTEVLIALYRERGDAFVDRLVGMYAFALWDSAERRLLLGRDPAGKKPLYYYLGPDLLVFGSEIKSLLLHPAVPRRPRLDLLPMVLAYGYAPTPETCFEGIRVLPPGQLLVVRDGQVNECARTYGERLVCTPGDGRAEDWVDELIITLKEAVGRRLVSDVPLGALLSGGLDSSLIVALVAEQCDQPVRTFSIGFRGHSSWDETGHAERVAKRFGTDHTPFVVEAPQVSELLPTLVWHYDQPFGDSSAIPTLVLSRLAREHVTVALGGDAGDELFGGYERFLAARLAGCAALRWLANGLAGLTGRRRQGDGYHDWLNRVRRFAEGVRHPLPEAYFRWVRLADDRLLDALLEVPADPRPTDHFRAGFPDADGRDWISRILDHNYRTYLLDDLLVKADRMSMAASLEVRTPFLDPAVVRLAGRIPTGLKLRGLTTKYILKEAARRYLPDDIVARRKHGFGVPLAAWLREGLREYAHHLLFDRPAAERGIFRREALEDLWQAHQSGRRDHGAVLWTLLTIEQWFRLFIDPAEVRAP